MGSRGSQNPNWQRWIPKEVPLAQVIGASGKSKDIFFNVPMPDSRMRVKISVLFKFSGAPSAGPAATLWLAETDLDESGAQGDLVPLTNIEGTSAAPTAIPADTGLLGYSREFISAADNIQGRLTIPANGATGYWVLQTRYQPFSVSFSSEEWGLIIAQCNPYSGGLVKVA